VSRRDNNSSSLSEVKTEHGVERVQQPAGLGDLVVVEASDFGGFDESVEHRGEMEDLLVRPAHRCERVVATDPSSNPWVDIGLVGVFVREDLGSDTAGQVAHGEAGGVG
jgi:hypothetical protein